VHSNLPNSGSAPDLTYLVDNKGLWQKSCHNKFSKDKVERMMRKREKEETRKLVDMLKGIYNN